jgi:hypothetical protein
MVSRTEPLSIAIDPDDGPRVPSDPLVARFLMRELDSSDGVNDLLALLEAPQQSLARRLAITGPTKAANSLASSPANQ